MTLGFMHYIVDQCENTRFFYKTNVYKKLRLKWPKSEDNPKKITRLNFQNCVFVGQKSIFRHYCIQNVKDRIQIRVYKINNESVTLFRYFISVTVTKNSRKSQAHYRKKLRKLRLRQNGGFLIKILVDTYV